MKGHLTKRGRKWYLVIRVPDKSAAAKQEWIPLEAADEKAAKNEQIQIVAQILAGKWKKPSPETVGEWLFYWLDEICKLKLKAGKLAPNTYKSYEETVRLHLAPGFNTVKLRSLTAGAIEKYYLTKLQSLSATTVNYHGRVLHAALRQAWVEDKIDYNPCDKAKPPAIAKYEAELPDQEQLLLILDEFADTPYYLPTILAATTGMRRGEVLGLTWDNVDFDNACVTVEKSLKQRKDGAVYFGHTKRQKRREVPLTEVALCELARAKAELELKREEFSPEWGKEWDVVCEWDNGEPIKPSTLTQRWRTIKERVGIDSKTRFHDLRHQYGTITVEHTDASIVADNMGHEQASTTRNYYIKPRMAAKRAAVSGLDREIFGDVSKYVRKRDE